MSMLWTAQDVAKATGGELQGAPWEACRVVIDSRSVQPGDLFVAIRGDAHDGHDFVADALVRGAVAAIVQGSGIRCQGSGSVVEVPDTMRALYDLAAAARARTSAKIIGVTGSVGKTSAKDALALAFAACGKTFATTGNLNNHIGLPLTLANVPPDAEFAVLEMGMNHAGEIGPLSRLARPHVALITTVEAVHIEFFDSVEGIADAKAEIFEGLLPGGIAVLNRDNPHFARLAAAAHPHEIFDFGTHPHARYHVESVQVSAKGTEIVATLAGTPVKYHVGAVGAHWGMVSASVLATVDAAGADMAKAAAALAHFYEPVGRGRLKKLPWGDGEIILMDDSYNASPASMRAAFQKLQAIKGAARAVAVLGDMRELGAGADAMHAGLAADILQCGIDIVFAAGPHMRVLYDALPVGVRGGYTENAESLVEIVVKAIKPGDLLLIKGSNGSRMRVVVEKIHAISGAEIGGTLMSKQKKNDAL